MSHPPTQRTPVLYRLSNWLQGELTDPFAFDDPTVVEHRLRILAANVAVPGVAAVASVALGEPLIAITVTVMMVMGLFASRLMKNAPERQVVSCRHNIWAVLISSIAFRVLINLSTTSAPYGIPSLMGENNSPVVQMLGTEILPALLYTALAMMPLFYMISMFQEYRSVATRGDRSHMIAMVGRYRKARRY